MRKLGRMSLLLITAAAVATAFSFAASAQLVEYTVTWSVSLPPDSGECPATDKGPAGIAFTPTDTNTNTPTRTNTAAIARPCSTAKRTVLCRARLLLRFARRPGGPTRRIMGTYRVQTHVA